MEALWGPRRGHLDGALRKDDGAQCQHPLPGRADVASALGRVLGGRSPPVPTFPRRPQRTLWAQDNGGTLGSVSSSVVTVP